MDKYAYHNGYVEFFTIFTKKCFESKSVACILFTVIQWGISYVMARQWTKSYPGRW